MGEERPITGKSLERIIGPLFLLPLLPHLMGILYGQFAPSHTILLGMQNFGTHDYGLVAIEP